MNRRHCVQICHGELDALRLELLIHLDDSRAFGLTAKSVRPALDQTEDLLLDNCRRIIFRTYERNGDIYGTRSLSSRLLFNKEKKR